jgi:hypothetical protein
MVFIGMNNHQIIKRIILRMITEEYPMVEDVQVTSYNDSGKYYYTIFLGIKYKDLLMINESDIKGKVKEIFKYVYPHDTLLQVHFYNPSDQ